MKVYFNTIEPVHNFYRDQFRHSPDGVDYIPSTPLLYPLNKEQNQFSQKNEKIPLLKKIRRWVIQNINPFRLAKLPVFKPLFMKDVDLIHSAEMLLWTNKPYVEDFEELSVFGGYSPAVLKWPHFKFFLKRMLLNPKLKKLLPWTEEAKRGMITYFKSDPKTLNKLLEKTEVVYPTVEPKENIVRQKRDVVKMLFVGKLFWHKGAFETIKVFEKLSRKYNIEMTIVSKIPDEILRRYGDIKGLHLIEGGPQVSDEQLISMYKDADIFFYPTHMCTLGFVIMEAMSYGLPVVSTTEFAVPEMIEDGVNGFVVENPYSDHTDGIKAFEALPQEQLPQYQLMRNPAEEYINKLSDAVEKLITDRELRIRMGDANVKLITEGKFSYKKRNEQLKRIYDECLK